MRHDRFVRLAAATIVLAAMLPGVAFAATHEPMRNHITLGFGYGQHLSDDFDDTDLESGGIGQLAYRYSLNRSVDLCVDARSFMASDQAPARHRRHVLRRSTSRTTRRGSAPACAGRAAKPACGPSSRPTSSSSRRRPRIEVDNVSEKRATTAPGSGSRAGADIRLSRLLSLPLELSYLYGKPEDLDVSSLGFRSG